jgi:hypothetical protein
MIANILLSIFKTNSLPRLALAASIASNVVKAIEQEFQAGDSDKNVALDTIIALLEACKTKQVPLPVDPATTK